MAGSLVSLPKIFPFLNVTSSFVRLFEDLLARLWVKVLPTQIKRLADRHGSPCFAVVDVTSGKNQNRAKNLWHKLFAKPPVLHLGFNQLVSGDGEGFACLVALAFEAAGEVNAYSAGAKLCFVALRCGSFVHCAVVLVFMFVV